MLDVDETVLDNSPYQGQLVIDDATYEGESWDRWVALRTATEVPGVVDFIRVSQSLGVHIVFVTNRRCRTRPTTDDACPQIEDTRVNLEAIGIDTSATTLFLRGEQPPQGCRELLTDAERGDGVWSSEKPSRRACVERDREMLMLFGDQLGDFIEFHDGDGGMSGRQVASAYFAAVQATPGFEVIPAGVVDRAMRELGLTSLDDPTKVRALGQMLEVDVVVVGAAICVELWNPTAWGTLIGEEMPEFRDLLEDLAG